VPWHVAWTRPTSDWTLRPVDGSQPERFRVGLEHVVAERLVEAGFEALCPVIRTVIVTGGSRLHWRGRARRQVVDTPAFQRYVLFGTTDLAPDWELALHIRGVTDVVRTRGFHPGIVPEGFVRAARGAKGDGVLEDDSVLLPFAKGGTVELLDGTYAGKQGVVESDKGRARVHVLLELIGRVPVRVSVPRDALKRIP
jgi:transcription antitermination factor NusG